MTEKILSIESVSAGYDDEIVISDVNLEVYSNDFIGVIGPNGGGKTTLLKTILGLVEPAKGSVNFFGKGKKVNQILIGYLPQLNQIDKKFPITVIDVVLSGLMSKESIFSRYGREQKLKAYETLDKMGILGLKKKPIGELSGGQLQRVFLSRAIISSPVLLLLDEPSTYVDSKFENDFYEILNELNKEMAILIVSHDVGTITWYVKTIACVNRSLHYHPSNIITEQQLASYNCPIQIITHGDVPHTVLKKHNH
jgi:zinc transport system ATP-binding protein